jgi:cobyrinic acid a,c-diamide synthase
MVLKKYSRIIFAGLKGGSGKTTISIGVISALKKKGLSVVPFKKGPDFIDSGWLSIAAQNPCYNLDPFLVSKEKVFESFVSHFSGDIAIIEGNRGLYDGMDVDGTYSTAELSKLISAPVILIVDCTKTTRTAAAIVLGCINFDKDVQIKGVILNQVANNRHESIIRETIEKYCSVPVIGAIPRLRSGEFPERHMGLLPYQEHYDPMNAVAFSEDIISRSVDLDKLIEIANDADLLRFDLQNTNMKPKDVRIGIIKDSAFQFYYPENLEELKKNGAEIIQIDAIKDEALPDIDALYIGGGFPETNAIKLAENISFRNSVKKAAEGGLPIYAECGGLMFLGDFIALNNEKFPMVGLFPLGFVMKHRPQAHGYTVLEVQRDNPFYPVGLILHGHEFHYSSVAVFERNDKRADNIFFTFMMKRGCGIIDGLDGICYKNVLASYTHIHALGVSEWVNGLLNKAREFKKQRRFSEVKDE